VARATPVDDPFRTPARCEKLTARAAAVRCAPAVHSAVQRSTWLRDCSVLGTRPISKRDRTGTSLLTRVYTLIFEYLPTIINFGICRRFLWHPPLLPSHLRMDIGQSFLHRWLCCQQSMDVDGSVQVGYSPILAHAEALNAPVVAMKSGRECDHQYASTVGNVTDLARVTRAYGKPDIRAEKGVSVAEQAHKR